MKEYKVITQKNAMGFFDPKQVEEALNTLGKDGWTFVGMTLTAKAGIMEAKE